MSVKTWFMKFALSFIGFTVAYRVWVLLTLLAVSGCSSEKFGTCADCGELGGASGEADWPAENTGGGVGGTASADGSGGEMRATGGTLPGTGGGGPASGGESMSSGGDSSGGAGTGGTGTGGTDTGGAGTGGEPGTPQCGSGICPNWHDDFSAGSPPEYGQCVSDWDGTEYLFNVLQWDLNCGPTSKQTFCYDNPNLLGYEACP